MLVQPCSVWFLLPHHLTATLLYFSFEFHHVKQKAACFFFNIDPKLRAFVALSLLSFIFIDEVSVIWVQVTNKKQETLSQFIPHYHSSTHHHNHYCHHHHHRPRTASFPVLPWLSWRQMVVYNTIVSGGGGLGRSSVVSRSQLRNISWRNRFEESRESTKKERRNNQEKGNQSEINTEQKSRGRNREVCLRRPSQTDLTETSSIKSFFLKTTQSIWCFYSSLVWDRQMTKILPQEVNECRIMDALLCFLHFFDFTAEF